MTLQRRLLIPLLIGVPLTWFVAFGYSVLHAGYEINELFDTQQIRLAQQVASVLPSANLLPTRMKSAGERRGAADLDDLSIAVWDASGAKLLFDREGAELPFVAQAHGFVDSTINGEVWRTYYLSSDDGTRIVAVGQELKERHELLTDLLKSQMLPWALMLPLLLAVIALSVRHALRPVRELARDLESRGAEDLRPVRRQNLPDDLQPMLAALNRLFQRIGAALENERRLTADAAHELRTPLAALRAQWEAVQVAPSDEARKRSLAQVGVGIERLSHLVVQLLALASAESMQTTSMKQNVVWPNVVGNALSDCLPMIETRGSDVEVHWPEDNAGTQPVAPLPLLGDEALLTTLLRNLIDNALRYSPFGSHVQVFFEPDRIVVEDQGTGVSPEEIARLGDRFHRAAGQAESGSGLGLSIVRRIAALHGLEVRFGNRPGAGGSAGGLRVELRRRASLAPA
ncbi:MAG TPA: ATP-binding protein [Burkholderiaceae bacterium]|nr:ATP-binding protein [Burkholderiaceae bacterium]